VALGAHHPVAGGAGDRVPVQHDLVVAGGGGDHRGRRGPGRAAGVGRGRGGAGDVVAVERGVDGGHVRRAVVQVAVVVVGAQPLHVAVGGAAAVGRAAAAAGVPGADVAAALVEELVADDERGLAVQVEGRAGEVTGELRIGLMPTFTRAVLAPVLDDFVPKCPEVRLHIVEGYSALLTEMVLDDELDFAVVPSFEGTIGLKSRILVRDREMLISGPRAGFKPLAPVRLSECRPLKIVAPSPDNIRRRNLETYFQAHGVEIGAMLEMDAMIATLEFVARSDWVTILPSVISVNDIGRGELIVNPIINPELHAEFVVIQPTRRKLSMQARMFLERFEAEVTHIHNIWDRAIAEPRKLRA